VPEAELDPDILNVSYRESCRSNSACEFRLGAQSGHLHTAGIGWIEFAQMINQR